MLLAETASNAGSEHIIQALFNFWLGIHLGNIEDIILSVKEFTNAAFPRI
jgi:hypothetical protein